MSDRAAALVPLAVNGDTGALNELFTRCMPQLRRTAARMLSNPQDSEDALQDGLLSGVRHVSKFQGRSRFSTWMHSIVANSAKSILRRQRCRPLTYSLDEPHPENETLTLSDMICDQGSGVEEHYGRVERLSILASILQKLPATHRSIICLCDIEGLCMEDAAERLGLTVSAAKTRHLRATRFLSKIARAARERQVPILEILAEETSADQPRANRSNAGRSRRSGSARRSRFSADRLTG
jgi:RNA polymerase sigma-70 factor, ECF subfamily